MPVLEGSVVFDGHLAPPDRDGLDGLVAAGLEVGTISDVTPSPHNGVRPPKRRRV